MKIIPILALVGPSLIVASAAAHAQGIEIKPVARLDLDAGTADEDSRSLDSGLMVRRAIIGIEGKVGSDWSFGVDYQMNVDGALGCRW